MCFDKYIYIYIGIKYLFYYLKKNTFFVKAFITLILGSHLSEFMAYRLSLSHLSEFMAYRLSLLNIVFTLYVWTVLKLQFVYRSVQLQYLF